MNKKIRCGRLIVYEDGTFKKLKGGSRVTPWDRKDLTFREIHYRFRKIFELSKMTKISLNNLIFLFSLILLVININHRFTILNIVEFILIDILHLKNILINMDFGVMVHLFTLVHMKVRFFSSIFVII